MSDTLIISLFGGPGSGKSTTAAAVFANLKILGYNVELVREYAKDVVWEGRHHLFGNQLYVFSKQVKRIRDLNGKVDIIITDSPLLLSLAYNTNEPFEFKGYVRAVNDQFNNYNVFIERVKPYAELGRMQTELEAMRLDLITFDLVGDFDLSVPGNQEGIEQLTRQAVSEHGLLVEAQ